MPSFTFICQNDHQHTLVRRSGRYAASCPECGETAMRFFGKPGVNTFTPYTTDHGGGDAEEIRTSRQEDEYCKRKGISRMLDSETFDLAKSKRTREARSKKFLEFETFEESVQAVDRVQQEIR